MKYLGAVCLFSMMVPFDYVLFIIICKIYNQNTHHDKKMISTINKHWCGNLLNYLLLTWLSLNKFVWVMPNFIDIPSIMFYFVVVDLSFFMVHYFCHLFLYSRIHMLHHSCKPLLAFCTRSSHAIDAAFENIAFMMPLLIFQFNGFIAYLCLITNAFWVSYLHTNCGTNTVANYHNEKIMRPRHHFVHHRYGRHSYNYALYFTFWDKLFGTYKGGAQIVINQK